MHRRIPYQSRMTQEELQMAAVKELLRAEADGTLSFGDFTLGSKTKKDNFEFEGRDYET